MRIWIIAILSMLFVSSCNQHGTLNRLEFAQIYKDSIRTIFPERVLFFDDDLSIVAIDSSVKDTVIYGVDNIYKEYIVEPDSLSNLFQTYLSMIRSQPVTVINIEKIQPIIKPHTYLQDIEAGYNENTTNFILFDKCAEDLYILYALDEGTHFSYLQTSQLKELNITQDSLKNLAVENFRKLVGETEVTHHDGNIQMVTMGGNYEASLLLLPELWHAGNLKVFGDFIIGISNRDLLLFTGSDNEKSVEELRRRTRKNYETLSYPLSPNLYKYVNGKLELYND